MFASACGEGVGGRSFSSNSLREDTVGRFTLCPSLWDKPEGVLRGEEVTGRMRRVQCGREKKLRPPAEELPVLSGTSTGRVFRAEGGTGLRFAKGLEVSARCMSAEGGCLFPKPSIPTMSAGSRLTTEVGG